MRRPPAAWAAYSAIRPLLFSLDAERAHHLTLFGMGLGHRLLGGLLPPSQPLPGIAHTAAGLTFPNRVGLAAGLDKNADHLDALGRLGFGFLEVGTVTPRPQPGNPRPRMFRLPQAQALINRLGFNNLGLAVFLQNVQRSAWVRERRGILGLNIGKNADTPIDRAVDDYQTGLEAVYPWADYVTVNISSPNTKNLRDLQSEQALGGLLQTLKKTQARLQAAHQKRVPLFLKIAPDLTELQLESIAMLMHSYEIEGLIATNTTLARPPGTEGCEAQGGLSGGPLLPRSLGVVRYLCRASAGRVPVIGCGGILSAADAGRFLDEGARLVQLYSGLIFRGPALAREVAAGLAARQRPWV